MTVLGYDVPGPPAALRLWIECGTEFQAHLLASALERLDAGVGAYLSRRRQPPLRLAVGTIRTGSIIADLTAVGDAAWTLYEKRDVLLGFVNQLTDGVQWLLSFGKIGETSSIADICLVAPDR